MAQAYPQFTPVQIFEAGQRAMADGRREYAAQFFQHLIDHYGDTPEAAGARDAISRMSGGDIPAPYREEPSGEPQRQGSANPNTQPPSYQPSPQQTAAPNLNGAGPASNAAQLAADRPTARPPNEHVANGHSANGGVHVPHAAGPVQYPVPPQLRHGPPSGQPPQATVDLPRHLARHSPASTHEAPQPISQTTYAAAPEKHYIIGRVVAGLLLLIGILGIFAGIALIYGAVSDPGVFGFIGAAKPGQALMFSVGVLISSVVMLITAQIATAIFNAADAAANLARLERYRMGDYDDDE
jgi:hypothetical protein